MTREDYRYSDGRRVFSGSTIKKDFKGRPQARTQAELQALYDCGMYGIEIVRRCSVRFELREAQRKGKTVQVERLWTGTVRLDDAAAVANFWRELERRIANEKQSTIERIRKQAEALIPRSDSHLING